MSRARPPRGNALFSKPITGLLSPASKRVGRPGIATLEGLKESVRRACDRLEHRSVERDTRLTVTRRAG